MADYADSSRAIDQNMADTAARNLQIGIQANQQMDAVWGQGTVTIGAQQKALDALSASVAAHQKAQDALKKSVEGIITTYQTEIATMGMTLLQVTEYKLRVDAAKLGLSDWLKAELLIIDALDKKKKWLDELPV